MRRQVFERMRFMRVLLFAVLAAASMVACARRPAVAPTPVRTVEGRTVEGRTIERTDAEPESCGGDGAPCEDPATPRALEVRSAEVEGPREAPLQYAPGVFTLTRDIEPPTRIQGELPYALQQPGLSGQVIVGCTVTAVGATEDCQVVKGVAGLDQDTLVRELGQWRFSPARRQGVAVSVRKSLLFQVNTGDGSVSDDGR
jgi:TonB family protein